MRHSKSDQEKPPGRVEFSLVPIVQQLKLLAEPISLVCGSQCQQLLGNNKLPQLIGYRTSKSLTEEGEETSTLLCVRNKFCSVYTPLRVDEVSAEYSPSSRTNA